MSAKGRAQPLKPIPKADIQQMVRSEGRQRPRGGRTVVGRPSPGTSLSKQHMDGLKLAQQGERRRPLRLEPEPWASGLVWLYENHASFFECTLHRLDILGRTSTWSHCAFHPADSRKRQSCFRSEPCPAPVQDSSRRPNLVSRQHDLIPKVTSKTLLV